MDNQQRKRSDIFLSIAALGIVFGDIGTSPIYAVRESIRTSGDAAMQISVMGVTSLIFWTLTLIVSVKYLLFITRVDNEGEGGIFAIASVLRTRAFKIDAPVIWLMTFIAICSTGLLFADSLITPALSIMAATEGAQKIVPGADQWSVSISVVIIVSLFSVQRFGTHAISRFFSPIMLTWFIAIAVIGLISIISCPMILGAVSPHHAFNLLQTLSWSCRFNLLGSILLAATGAEALYADMGHFGRRPINIAWYGFALIALLLSYFGQGAWLLANNIDKRLDINPFFEIIPNSLMAPMVILATVASVIAGQAVISGMFSLANQAIKLNFLPRLKVVHTSFEERGQIYVPVINFLLLVGGVLLVLVFRNSSALASSYGFAVSATMFLTTAAFSLVILYVWEWSYWKIIAFVFFAIPLDFIYLAATITKLPSGHFFTLIMSLLVSWLLAAWYLGNIHLAKCAQRIDIPLSDFAEMIEMRGDLVRTKRPAIFFQHLPVLSDADITPNALLRQIQMTSLLYQPTIIVEFVDSGSPTIPEGDRMLAREYSNNIHVIQLTFGYWEAPTIEPVVDLGKIHSWWKAEEEIVFFGIREDLRVSKSNELSRVIKYPYYLLHKMDRPVARELHLNAMQYIELGMPINI